MAATTSTARRTAPRRDRFLGVPVAPITHRRLVNFRANRRGWWSLWIFLALFFVSLFAEFVANSKPIVVSYDGALYWPIFQAYPETTFGGEFPTETDYNDPYVVALIRSEARRVGKECVSRCRYRGWTDH